MMKKFITVILMMFSFTMFMGCDDSASSNQAYQCPMKCEGEKIVFAEGNCSVCGMKFKPISSGPVLADEISEESIFNLSSKWTNQNEERLELVDLKGDVVVMVMIYTTCKAACPRLVADMRNIQKELGDQEGVNYVMVSIDPETDTPQRLKEFAKENQMDNSQWTFLNGSVDDVRELANVLAVKYKSISPMDFSHSNIISVFDQGGVLQYQEEGLGVDNQGIVATVNGLIN